jgi:NADPH-dependent 2,4-dienoyl-CoA reductase/sulfur reductase-like enzyme
MTTQNYVIIGCGVAAIAAAQAIREKDRSGELVLISDERAGYYSRPGLAYLLSDEVPETQLYPFSETDFKLLKTKRVYGRVTRVEPQKHLLVFQDQTSLAYNHLLLATGAQAARLTLPGSDLQGIVTLDTLQDARDLLKLARQARTALVVGGGITALEIAEALLIRKVKTHYFIRGDRFWSNVLDENESRLVERRLKERGLQVHFSTEVRELIGQRGKLTGVRTQDGKILNCDVLALAIGVLPRTELAQTAGLSIDRGILVNEKMQTSAGDIFAAGDSAQVFDPPSGRYVLDSLWTPARQQGRIAGLNMAGIAESYSRTAPVNVSRLADIPVTIIGAVGRGSDQDLTGIARGESESWSLMPDAISTEAIAEVYQVRIVIGQNKLIGALILGDQTISRPLQELITRQVDISAIRQPLLQKNAPIVRIIMDFWKEFSRENDRSPKQQ